MRSTTAVLIAAGLAANLAWALTAGRHSPSESPGVESPNHPTVPESRRASPPALALPHARSRGDTRPTVERTPHLVAVPADFGEHDAPAENPALERAFDAEPEDPERAAKVADAAKTALAADPDLSVHDVRCTLTFCRLRMTKPIQSALAWHQVDQLLAPIARGETIFTARPHDDANTTAHVYFSEPDAALPLDQVRPPGVRPGV
jgi:hypothetical protein